MGRLVIASVIEGVNDVHMVERMANRHRERAPIVAGENDSVNIQLVLVAMGGG